MSARSTIQTQCPTCSKKYHVPSRSLGHRARCIHCDSVFRVADSGGPRPPTEEDILRWLSEADEPDVLAQPSVVGRREEESLPASAPNRLDAQPALAELSLRNSD